MSAQTIKSQAARIEHLMPGDAPRQVRILDNGGTEHATLNLYTAVHSGRYKGRARGFAGYEEFALPIRSTRRVLRYTGV